MAARGVSSGPLGNFPDAEISARIQVLVPESKLKMTVGWAEELLASELNVLLHAPHVNKLVGIKGISLQLTKSTAC